MTALSLVPDERMCLGKPGKLDEILIQRLSRLGSSS